MKNSDCYIASVCKILNIQVPVIIGQWNILIMGKMNWTYVIVISYCDIRSNTFVKMKAEYWIFIQLHIVQRYCKLNYSAVFEAHTLIHPPHIFNYINKYNRAHYTHFWCFSQKHISAQLAVFCILHSHTYCTVQYIRSMSLYTGDIKKNSSTGDRMDNYCRQKPTT